MKKKQLLGLLAAALIFAFVCSMSILTNHLLNKMFDEEEILDTLLSTDSGYVLPTQDFIGVVDVDGVITNTASSGLFGTIGYDHQKTLDYITDLESSEYNKGILLCVNSPGGGVYESDELYLKLKEYKQLTERPVWTYMKSQACSGGYYIAMASDKIIANRNSWTGSIGVIISLSNYKELMDKIGVEEINITSGANKSMGSSGEVMTKEQKDILQSIVDESYNQFAEVVSEGRKLDIDTVKKIADGRIYTSKQAIGLKLIDEIDTYENALNSFQRELGNYVTVFTPQTNNLTFTSLFGAVKDMKTKSDAEIMSEFLKTEGNGVPMYYANPKQY